MTKVAVYNQTGEKTGDLDLNAKIFGVEKISVGLVHAAVRTQRNNLRKPFAHSKTRDEVAGSGRKPWKQKGTGRARAGSVRSPLWRHGGITFGPRNQRDFSLKLNKSAFRKALFTILTDKARDNRLVVLEKFDTTAKTKELSQKLNGLAAKTGFGKKFILIIENNNKELARASRNLPNVKLIVADQLNVVDLLKHDAFVTKEALNVIEKTYLK